MLPSQPNQSIANGLACLEIIANAPQPLGSREIARQIGLGHTTVSRLLNTLAHLQYLDKTPKRKFVPGPGLHVLTAQSLAKSRLLRAALPALHSLVDEHRYRVALGTLWRGWVSYLFFDDPEETFETGFLGHAPTSAVESSIGLVMLAHAIDRTEFPTDLTPIQQERVSQSHLTAIRQDGFALIDYQNGILSLSRALGQPVSAALALSVRTDSGITKEMLAARTAIAVAQIEVALNGDAPLEPFERKPL